MSLQTMESNRIISNSSQKINTGNCNIAACLLHYGADNWRLISWHKLEQEHDNWLSLLDVISDICPTLANLRCSRPVTVGAGPHCRMAPSIVTSSAVTGSEKSFENISSSWTTWTALRPWRHRCYNILWIHSIRKTNKSNTQVRKYR